MTSRRRLAPLAVALAACASLVAPAVAAGPVKVTGAGVGKVKVGATHASLRAKGVVGKQIPGCELAGPQARAAMLKAPLTGAVQLSRSKPRVVDTIVVTKGPAKAKGVGFGDSLQDIADAFPHARVDHSTEEVFAITLVTVPRRDGGKFQFGVDPDADEITVMGVPFIAFCE